MSDEIVKSDEAEAKPVSELDRLKAERARLIGEREKRDAARVEAEEAERIKREIADEEAIAKAEAQHGPIGRDIATVQSRSHGVIIMKRPTHASYRQMIDAVGAGKMTLTAINERFAFQCLVHPERVELERILKSEAGLLERVANAAAALGGLVVEEAQGK